MLFPVSKINIIVGVFLSILLLAVNYFRKTKAPS